MFVLEPGLHRTGSQKSYSIDLHWFSRWHYSPLNQNRCFRSLDSQTCPQNMAMIPDKMVESSFHCVGQFYYFGKDLATRTMKMAEKQ